MKKSTKSHSEIPGQIDIFALLDEEENGPPRCDHMPGHTGGKGRGWVLELDPKSAYYWEWVHAEPSCRRSKFPGRKHDDNPPVPFGHATSDAT